jgi:hypothetical protein
MKLSNKIFNEYYTIDQSKISLTDFFQKKLEEEIIGLKLFVEFNKPVIETDFNNGYYQGILTMLGKITEILEE